MEANSFGISYGPDGSCSHGLEDAEVRAWGATCVAGVELWGFGKGIKNQQGAFLIALAFLCTHGRDNGGQETKRPSLWYSSSQSEGVVSCGLKGVYCGIMFWKPLSSQTTRDERSSTAGLGGVSHIKLHMFIGTYYQPFKSNLGQSVQSLLETLRITGCCFEIGTTSCSQKSGVAQ